MGQRECWGVLLASCSPVDAAAAACVHVGKGHCNICLQLLPLGVCYINPSPRQQKTNPHPLPPWGARRGVVR
uniref:Putative secreted protein n=1 Tax=Anopheles darlingi TaxID=43151 RepID=A0A2M4DNG3_ANODA